MVSPIYDVIIIGGGIAGLYAAYKIKKNDKNTSILILEKEDRVGGRAGNEMFHNTSISIGAGVGRKKKDANLIKLIGDLGIQYNEFETSTHYTSALKDSSNILGKQFRYLRSTFQNPIIQNHFRNKTFAEFAKRMLGPKQYEFFSQCAGYTDYERADISDILNDYGFDDNFTSWTAISLHWSELIEALVKYINSNHIRTNQPVVKIIHSFTPNSTNSSSTMSTYNFEVLTQTQNRYKCRNIIIASTVDTVMKLLPSKHNIYSQIQGQPFLRVYGKFTKQSTRIMTQYVQTQTVVQGPIHKIIPMSPENGVFMIVYTDNSGARTLRKYSENTAKNCSILCRYLEESLAIPSNTLVMTDMRDFYWKIGTHYYEPINHNQYESRKEFIYEAQRPFPNVYVVGEMISRDQGWVRGALDSVDKVIPTRK
jgi:NAD(P)-binding Rossmann-like domain